MNGLLHRTMHTVAALLAATVSFTQWHFRLDTTFRTSITERNVNSMAFLSTGELLLSGRIRFQTDPPWVSADRYLASVDVNGEQVPEFPYGYGGGKLTPWEDRFYVSVGQTVRRVFSSGMVDPSFIGLNSGPYFMSLFGGDYHVYPEGHVLVSGRHDLLDSIRGFVGKYNLMWFSNEGYLDTTRIHRKGNNCFVNQFAELPNGQFICTSTCSEFEGEEVDRVFRVNADGTPDTTFRTGVYFGGAQAYLPLPDGRVYAGGNFRRTEAPQDTLWLVRFMPDGSLDPTFSIPHFASGGGVTAPWGPYVRRILPWIDGNLLVAGTFKYVNGEPRHGLCMIDTSGQLLPAFAGNWLGTHTNGIVTSSSINDILPNADTTAIYICGAYTGYGDGEITDPTQRFVSRLLVEEDTGTTGVQEVVQKVPALRLYPNPASTHVTVELERQPRNGTLLLRDALGREVLRQRVVSRVNTVPLHGLGGGVYLLEHWEAGERREAGRLVVRP
jgi:hypothetical protein